MISIFTRAALCPIVACSCAFAGTYSAPTDTTHAIDPAITSSSTSIVEWANWIDETRTTFADGGSDAIDQTGGFNSLGELTASDIDSGTEPGFITVTFPAGVANDDGHDFAVFENGFVVGSEDNLFAELAYVEVSTNGSDFARFPSVSLNTLPSGGNGPFASFDMTNVNNLAGKHAAGFGTPFDLEELSSNASVLAGLIDLANIQYVRLVDIPGSGDFLDSRGSPILDAWPTEGSGGFDFRLGEGLGVGVLNIATVPEPSGSLFAFPGLIFVLLRCRKSSSADTIALLRVAVPMLTIVFVAIASPQLLIAQTVVDFEELTSFTAESSAGGGSFFNGNVGSGTTNRDGWSSQGVRFSNSYNGDSLPAFDFWDGWAYSNVANSTTAGFSNQYAATTGGGADDNGNAVAGEKYAVAYLSGSYFDVPDQLQLRSVDVTNTTFAALSMLNGDSFAKKFGGATGGDPDLFQVTFAGYDSTEATGSVLGTVSVSLADFRFVDDDDDFVLDHWQTVDLSAISDARSVAIEFASTDVGNFGINTPTYVAVDNIRLSLIPEPGGPGPLGLAAALAISVFRRRRRS